MTHGCRAAKVRSCVPPPDTLLHPIDLPISRLAARLPFLFSCLQPSFILLSLSLSLSLSLLLRVSIGNVIATADTVRYVNSRFTGASYAERVERRRGRSSWDPRRGCVY